MLPMGGRYDGSIALLLHINSSNKFSAVLIRDGSTSGSLASLGLALLVEGEESCTPLWAGLGEVVVVVCSRREEEVGAASGFLIFFQQSSSPSPNIAGSVPLASCPVLSAVLGVA